MDDELPGRGRLGLRAAQAIRSGRVPFRSPFAVARISAASAGLMVVAEEAGKAVTLAVERIVVATGFRPDLSMLSELRLSLDLVDVGAGAADRSQHAFLRHGAPARRGRIKPSG